MRAIINTLDTKIHQEHSKEPGTSAGDKNAVKKPYKNPIRISQIKCSSSTLTIT